MITLSYTEENYLKCIFTLADDSETKLANLSIASHLGINPATVTEMLRKLHEKNLIHYDRLKGARLTKEGRDIALLIVRKHRLWETFLVEKLNFSWDEVHEIAEQLEHIQSDKLINKMDEFLSFPKFDPHGDPIPDKDGKIPSVKAIMLSEAVAKKTYQLARVTNHTNSFLQFLNKTGLSINDRIEVTEINEFDRSMSVVLNGEKSTFFSAEVAKSLLVMPER